MARYFFGNSLASLLRTAYNIVDGNTAVAASFDSSQVGSCILIPAGSGYVQTMPFIDASSTTTLWTKATVYISTTAGTTDSTGLIYWVNSTGTVVARLWYPSSGTLQFQYWNGTSYVNLGASISFSTASRFTVTAKITAGVSGTIDIWFNSTLVLTATGMNAAVNNFAAVRFQQLSSSGNLHLSQISGADYDIRDVTIRETRINGNGALTDGVGTFTDINETVMDEATLINLPAVNNRKSFTKEATTTAVGYTHSLCIGGRVRVSGGTVTNGKFLTRISGTNYLSPSLAPDGGMTPRGAYWDQNPATATAWTAATYDSAEAGIEAN